MCVVFLCFLLVFFFFSRQFQNKIYILLTTNHLIVSHPNPILIGQHLKLKILSNSLSMFLTLQRDILGIRDVYIALGIRQCVAFVPQQLNYFQCNCAYSYMCCVDRFAKRFSFFFPHFKAIKGSCARKCIQNIWRLLKIFICWAHNLFLCRFFFFFLINRNARVIVYDIWKKKDELKFKRNHPHNPYATHTQKKEA